MSTLLLAAQQAGELKDGLRRSVPVSCTRRCIGPGIGIGLVVGNAIRDGPSARDAGTIRTTMFLGIAFTVAPRC
jgi:hypothetical protein